ncbi:MAG: hypothetical protein GWN67_07660 [Phycisphaerae bacterium]|nr:hypothetical protein [Phycisphaerae bacterium]NIP54857.1 hypothetical protein [Phycisphaerae bacterium]NIS52165.1 hypothetical protein [Phycisphaerae bacterium]NIU11146.1 hypothetical protein [Phycisphaerae bacterium]NIU56251.1 hypothetical protein [Phycisphaerae bacterium]
MAKITFNLEEITEIVISNKLLPTEIIRVRVKGEKVHFIIRTNSFILPYIPASLRFLSFSDNNAIFELTIISGHLSKAKNWLNEALKLRIPSYMKLEYPQLSVDIDKLLKDKNITGFRVKDILLEGGEFTICTCNN